MERHFARCFFSFRKMCVWLGCYVTSVMLNKIIRKHKYLILLLIIVLFEDLELTSLGFMFLYKDNV